MSQAGASGTLYLVPTPIGNEADITRRAVEVLGTVEIIAAEDTRVAATLLRRLGLRKRVVSYHDHNELERAPWLVERLLSGADVALISDAGTPAISDPGYRVITLAIEHGVRIRSLPGASAVLAALVVSGLPTDRFSFAGFLPRRPNRRREALQALRGEPGTLIYFEAPHRLLTTLDAMLEVLGDRRAMIGVNLTKLDERSLYGNLSTLRAEIASWAVVRGECTLVVAGADRSGSEAWPDAERAIKLLQQEGLAAAAISRIVAELYRLPRRAVYDRVLAAQQATKDRLLS